jgi:putative membrane protein
MELVKNIFYGAVVGIANIIPGVSGGTMALVLGFYERLIDAIHNISGETIKALLGIFRFEQSGFDRFKSELRRIDAGFLAAIASGALAAIVVLASLMTYLLKEWHDPTYGFFFGLVLVSALVPYRIIKQKTVPVFISFILAGAGILAVSGSISDAEKIEKARVKYELSEKGTGGNTKSVPVGRGLSASRMVYLFFTGAVAISAMILPGVSGSLLLLILGAYFDILTAVADRDFIILGIFAAGCLAGILLFTRLLNFLLKRWSDQTMSGLLGLVVGSLWMIWPFRNSARVGEEVLYLSNRIPSKFGNNELLTIVAAIAGMGIVALFIKMEGPAVEDRDV